METTTTQVPVQDVIFEEVQANPLVWGLGGAAIAAAALWFFGGRRTKVKIRKIFK